MGGICQALFLNGPLKVYYKLKILYFVESKFPLPSAPCQSTRLKGKCSSSLHWSFSLPFLFIFIQWSITVNLELSISDVKIVKKVPMEI